jgi:hypothetical protein
VGWLISPVITSILVAIIVVKIWDLFTAGLTSSAASVVRAGLFIGTWATVTAGVGMRSFAGKVRQLRQGTAAIKALSRFERP